MSDTAIRAASLGKVFRVWRHPSDILKEALTGRRHHSEFAALRDVSFDVTRGSVVGIMGRNGAGKSTLLRIIAGTLDATSGSVLVAGRISAILELGTGFHPEYSGRENVFLGGLCLGLTRAEIAQRLDEIVAFAELEEFIDQPFRTYSSGMQARLTFSVATAVDPDILIIDEALAVGDARFQLKSFDRVRQFRRQGKSILLVSHSIDQVVSICDRAILLERGSIFAQGEPSLVGNIYHELLFGPQVAATEPLPALDVAISAPGNRAGEAKSSAPTVAQSFGRSLSPQEMATDVNADSDS
jgi:lipopolysaccharide transport system ATP-binding protein